MQLPGSWCMEVQTGPVAACLSGGRRILACRQVNMPNMRWQRSQCCIVAHQKASTGTEVALVN